LTALEQHDFGKGVRREQVEIRRYDKHLEITRFCDMSLVWRRLVVEAKSRFQNALQVIAGETHL
jgi:hypothetical protein